MTLVEIKSVNHGTVAVNPDYVVTLLEAPAAETLIILVGGIKIFTIMPREDLVKLLTQETG